MVVSLVGEMAS
jgi:hypothetical protein